MKKYNKNAKTYHKKMYFMCSIFFLCFIFWCFLFFYNQKIFAETSENEIVKEEKTIYKNKNPINLDEIIEKNTQKNIKEEMCVEEIDLEYTTQYKQNSELAKGTVQVLQEGRTGKQNVIVIKKYENDELISEELVAENILKSSIDRIVEVGTGIGYTYTINEGDNIYITASSASIRLEPDENAEKICTLNKNESAKVLKIEDDWLFVSTGEIRGYIAKDCVTSKNPNANSSYADSSYSKQQLLNKLSFNMDLRTPSGLSLDQFKKVLSNDVNDKNNVFSDNAEYFYYIEKQYHINGIFVASVGIHESAWGTSIISLNKKNLFGYGAVDSNPYGGAYSFASYSEGIDLVSRVFVKYYLNPEGTVIYDGTKANGKFYSGSNLSAVNSKYASDKNWANGIYKWMEYLYKKI